MPDGSISSSSFVCLVSWRLRWRLIPGGRGSVVSSDVCQPSRLPNLCGVLVIIFRSRVGNGDQQQLGRCPTHHLSLWIGGCRRCPRNCRVFRRSRTDADPRAGRHVASALFSACWRFVKYLADPYDKLPSIVYWLMGSFALSEWSCFSARSADDPGLGILIAMVAGRLNVLSLGDEPARALGLRGRALAACSDPLGHRAQLFTVSWAEEKSDIGSSFPFARTRCSLSSRSNIPSSATSILASAWLLLVSRLSTAPLRCIAPRFRLDHNCAPPTASCPTSQCSTPLSQKTA